MDQYVYLSLEVNMFFARIMKEHALFLEAGFLPPNACHSKKAETLKQQFEDLLRDTVKAGNGMLRSEVLRSGELVTKYTAAAEKKTEELTGIAIDGKITAMELQLNPLWNRPCSPEMRRYVHQLNQRALALLCELIPFKETVLNEMLTCRIATANYPLLIQHIIREAKLYQCYIEGLEKRGTIAGEQMRNVELFWNQIMMEHALFIRGLLDPSEDALIQTADQFAKDYRELLKEASQMNDRTLPSVTRRTIEETRKYRDFKEAGTKGINGCEIKSIILPLLADHVLREANHYLRILENK